MFSEAERKHGSSGQGPNLLTVARMTWAAAIVPRGVWSSCLFFEEEEDNGEMLVTEVWVWRLSFSLLISDSRIKATYL